MSRKCRVTWRVCNTPRVSTRFATLAAMTSDVKIDLDEAERQMALKQYDSASDLLASALEAL